LTFEEDFTAEESYHAPLKTILETALQSFMKMKQQEGVLIQKDIEHRLALIQEKIKIIEEQALQAPQRYRERLIARLEDLLPGKVENEERIIREVAILAEKLDISEEIHRFSTHVNHFNELLNSDSKEVGKTLEFVLQELNREINTIGSKSSDLQIARGVIEVKSELEKIREQVQNVE
jgi:uncharacterized protein (TIGR00255 family)